MAHPSHVTTDRLLAFLQDPAEYPHRPKRVRIVQTHISIVAIAPPYVYKVKKPVDFGFVDFSTLEKRRYFCEREVVLNRRLCPYIYLGVLPISRKGSRLVGGKATRSLNMPCTCANSPNGFS